MKIPHLFRSLAAGTLIMLAGAPLWLAPAAGRDAAGQPAAASPFHVIRGMVSAKTPDHMTVDGTIIDTPATVDCTRDGRSIMLPDIHVGDRVEAHVFVDRAHGTTRALAIRVLGR